MLSTFWDIEYYTFFLWDEAQDKFNLTLVDCYDWILMSFKIIDW